MTTRRSLVSAGLAAVVLRPAVAGVEPLHPAIAAFVGNRPLHDGRITLALDELVENGNSVPVTVTVASPMTEADHVQRIGLFALQNPQPEVAVFHLSPVNGVARVSTRMRLATSQAVIALAQTSDGRCWQGRFEVVVTLAACIE
ncbi:MAG: thiosulfate oxidation carrier protein SoxY [Rubrivivax sp.]|nr:thiosulfate oxidation carrier protein SoxY [Rubrivivax sp.]